jgi:hypothetical protein
LTCSNRQYDYVQTDYPDTVWTVGPMSNIMGTLSFTQTLGGHWVWESCQLALTAAANVVVVVVTACRKNSADSQSNSAINIAQQIVAKVPTKWTAHDAMGQPRPG